MLISEKSAASPSKRKQRKQKRESKSQSANGLVPFDKYVYKTIVALYIAKTTLLLVKLKCSDGMLAGSLKRLKDAKWIVFVPSFDGYMTSAAYKRRISDAGDE